MFARLGRLLAGVALALLAPAVLASFHLYQIEELFSDASGAVQFIVLHESSGANGENLWSGHALTATGSAGTHTFTFPRNLPSSSTANTRVLVATQGFADLGLVTPDYIVPNGFLSLDNGTVNFAGVDQVGYAALPRDGTTALARSGSAIANVATNFAGQSASVAIVQPPAAANYQGLWWAAPAGSESGWGLNVAHDGDTIFASWFTYDPDGRAWWLVMTAQKTPSGSYAGTLYETRGPAFSTVPFDPAQVSAQPVGTGTLTFADANTGSFSYVVNGISQTKAVTREVFAALPTCGFGLKPDLTQATNYQGLWWNAPAGSESGWGINLNHQGDTIFATWFTYDFDRKPLWLVAIAPKTGPGTYTGSLLRTTGPPFNAVPFLPAGVNATNVGTATFTFANGNSATFAYTVQLAGMASPVTQAKPLTREVLALPGTACQ